MGIKVHQLDTSNIVNASNCYYKTADNIHMTKTTYGEIGNKLTLFMRNNGIL